MDIVQNSKAALETKMEMFSLKKVSTQNDNKNEDAKRCEDSCFPTEHNDGDCRVLTEVLVDVC